MSDALIGLVGDAGTNNLNDLNDDNHQEYANPGDVTVAALVAVDNGDRLKAACDKSKHVVFDNMSHVLKDASSADRMAQYYEVYINNTRPLTKGLTTTIAEFINNLK